MAYSDIKDPSAHFQAVLWTGDGLDNKQITNDGNSDLQPDWVWLKDRTQAESPAIFDSSRGATVRLQPNGSTAESTETATLKSFTTDGFTVGTSGSVNNGTNPDQYVAWQWKANGGTTSSNTAGSTTTTVQVNQDAGFSIVTYVGNGNAANQTLGHGLGVAPDMIISKRRGASTEWPVYHKSLGVGSFMYLSQNYASSTTNPPYKDTPTSTVFSTQYEFQASDYWVSYCFAEKQGYSKFGKYVGNGNADGPFIYTGFKPAFVLIKRTDSADNWFLYDNKRSAFNEADKYIRANIANAEGSNNFQIDMLSNGFKTRNSGTFIGALNASGGSYIYMAFAEHPFVAGGIPTTAR